MFSEDQAAILRAKLVKYSVQDVGGCHTWTASRRGKGYANLRIPGGGSTTAHRVSYEVHKGPIPDGMFVLHACDNRLCVNPDHLRLGTHGENMADMRKKSRQACGERQGKARLTAEAVTDIRGGRLSVAGFAELYGVSREAVYDAKVGRYWKHIA